MPQFLRGCVFSCKPSGDLFICHTDYTVNNFVVISIWLASYANEYVTCSIEISRIDPKTHFELYTLLDRGDS